MHSENKTSGLSAYDHIHIYIFDQILKRIYGKVKSICILQNTGNISENNPPAPGNPEYF